MTDICAGPPRRHGDGVEGGVGVDSAAWDGVAIDAGVDAATGDKPAAGPTSITVCGLWVFAVDAATGDGGCDTVAASAAGDATAAAVGSAIADDCEGDGCSAPDGDAADRAFAVAEAFAAVESAACDGEDCAACDGCIEPDDAGDAWDGGAAASGASAAIFGVASAEGMPVGDPAMAVDAVFADAALVDEMVLAEVLLAIDAAADVLAGGGTSALVTIRLAADAGLAASFAAVCGAFNGAAADAGIDDSVIAEESSGLIPPSPPKSRV